MGEKLVRNNIQDTFLNIIRKKKIKVTVFLTNGAQIRGCIISTFDGYTIILEDPNGKQQMIFKHAISTITSDKKVEIE